MIRLVEIDSGRWVNPDFVDSVIASEDGFCRVFVTGQEEPAHEVLVPADEVVALLTEPDEQCADLGFIQIPEVPQ